MKILWNLQLRIAIATKKKTANDGQNTGRKLRTIDKNKIIGSSTKF